MRDYITWHKKRGCTMGMRALEKREPETVNKSMVLRNDECFRGFILISYGFFATIQSARGLSPSLSAFHCNWLTSFMSNHRRDVHTYSSVERITDFTIVLRNLFRNFIPSVLTLAASHARRGCIRVLAIVTKPSSTLFALPPHMNFSRILFLTILLAPLPISC